MVFGVVIVLVVFLGAFVGVLGGFEVLFRRRPSSDVGVVVRVVVGVLDPVLVSIS